ncbi:membrane protein WF-2 [Trichonephila clavata]|uniref:Membrane protein WF-2 n=1 Tax=Trichonephila clavata TaxID=2740835 RepID=A0A8X6K5G8_TRICU|nr:membrane protein WF-2 [Trichonephila clavata]
MIGVSQMQFPSKESSKLKFVGYSATFVSLIIITNPVNVLFSLGTMFFRSEIKTLYIYKEIKTAKQQKMSKREYWEIFFKNNTIKVAAFLLFSAFITYLAFTTTFLLISLLGTIPLTMLLILLQSELRPKDFNPFTLLKASINFFLEGIKENLRGMVNDFDVTLEHLLPHQLNDDIVKNIDKLKDKYCEQVPEDVIKNDEYIQFIRYIDGSYEFSDEDKGRVIEFLGDFCKDDQKHSSGFTGGQILLLVLKACNDGDREAAKNKKDALITNLLDSQTFSRKERIPNTCFTGIVYRMLSTLEGIHPDPKIRFTPPRQILLSEAQNEAREFMLDRLKNKKNNKEIFKAWYDVQNGYEDDENQKVVGDFISEVSIPLMRKLLSITSQYSEQIVLTLMKNIGSIKLNKLQCFDVNKNFDMSRYIKDQLEEHGLDDQESLFESIEEKVFLELLNKDVLCRNFLVGRILRYKAAEVANMIIKKEVAEFKLKAEKTIEGQIISMLDGLRMLPREKRCYRVYAELSKNNENDKEKIKKILQKKLAMTEAVINDMLKKEASCKLELEIEDIYNQNKCNITTLYEKIKEVKQGFIEDGLLTTQEIDKIVKERIITLNNEARIIPSSNLSRILSVNNLAAHEL